MTNIDGLYNKELSKIFLGRIILPTKYSQLRAQEDLLKKFGVVFTQG